MMTDAEIEKYRGRLSAQDHLEGAGQVTIEPNCTDAAGRRDEDFQPLNEGIRRLHRAETRIAVDNQTNQGRFRVDRTLPDEYGLCQECEPIPRGAQLDALCAPLRALSIELEEPISGLQEKSNRLPLTHPNPPHMRFGPGVQV